MNNDNLVSYLENRENDLKRQINDYEQRIVMARGQGRTLDDAGLTWLKARQSEIHRLFAYLDVQKKESGK